MSNSDEYFMRQALALAKKGLSWTNPHPLVGAVVVKDGQVVAQGYHHQFGAEHAEADAILNSSADLRGATMYVTLEPCHLPYDLHGHRIPCCEYVAKAGIKQVHIAMLDSNPEESGKARMVLEAAGIPTTLGCLGEEALALNAAYHHFMTHHRPFVVATFSASLDGKIATFTGESKWITNEKAREYARGLRATCQAILVGKNTVLRDNPHLGCRNKKYQDPIRIVLDSQLSIPLDSQVLRDSHVIVATTQRAPQEKIQTLEKQGIKVLIFEGAIVPIDKLLSKLAELKIISILVEGGGQTLGSFFDAGVVNKVYAFQAPMIIGGAQALSPVGGRGAETMQDVRQLRQITHRRFGDDLLTIGYPEK